MVSTNAIGWSVRVQLDAQVDAITQLPANDRYPPIRIGEGDELAIWGVVRWNLHRLAS